MVPAQSFAFPSLVLMTMTVTLRYSCQKAAKDIVLVSSCVVTRVFVVCKVVSFKMLGLGCKRKLHSALPNASL